MENSIRKGRTGISYQDSGFKWLSYSDGYITDPCQETIRISYVPFQLVQVFRD